MEGIKAFISDITVEQFIHVLTVAFFFFLVLSIVCYLAFSLLNVIFNLIYLCFRKDKYKNVDFLIVKSCKYISRLRKQVQNAPTDNEYLLLYNRLVGAVGLMIDFKVIRPDVSAKILNVKRNNGE